MYLLFVATFVLQRQVWRLQHTIWPTKPEMVDLSSSSLQKKFASSCFRKVDYKNSALESGVALNKQKIAKNETWVLMPGLSLIVTFGSSLHFVPQFFHLYNGNKILFPKIEIKYLKIFFAD